MKKRLLAMILAMVMVCALVPVAGAADMVAREVIPCKYDYVHGFSEGLAAVSLYNKWGFIDKTGKEVIPCKYDEVGSFSEGLVAVRVGDYKTGKWGFVDKTGREVIPCTLEYRSVGDFDQGLAKVEDKNWKYGFIDTTGREVIPCKYSDVGDFSENLATVRVGDWSTGKCGYIDRNGKEVVPCKYDNVFPFSEGLGLVNMGGQSVENWACIEGTWGFVDATGREVIPCTLKYDVVGSFSNGLAGVGMSVDYGETNCGFINTTGKEVIPCKYRSYWNVYSFSEGLVCVRIDGKDGFIDTAGREVIPFRYDGAGPFCEGLAIISTKTGEYWDPAYEEYYPIYKRGFIDRSGKVVVECKYDYAWSFSNGFAQVSLDNKYGFVDKTGKEVVPCKYDYVGDFSEGFAVVELNGKYGFIAATEVGFAHPSTQEVEVDGEKVTFQCYALKDAAGNDTNYIKLRDLADILNGSAAQFEVGWDGNITITTKTAYTKNGTEQNAPFSGRREYEKTAVKTLVDGVEAELDTFQLKDDAGGGYTYYKLRDLGKALGITVDWSAERGIFIETK